MTHLVAATVLSLAPSPSDLMSAHADLHAPLGAPALAARSPRAKIALLLAMVQLDVLDRDAGDYLWFGTGGVWDSDLNLARTLVQKVGTCPPLPADWIPPAAWFASESAGYYAVAEAYRRRADEYRGRAEMEGHQSEDLLAWAREFDVVAEAQSEMGGRYAAWSGCSWSRPRRVALAEIREWLGEDAWSARRWPVSE